MAYALSQIRVAKLTGEKLFSPGTLSRIRVTKRKLVCNLYTSSEKMHVAKPFDICLGSSSELGSEVACSPRILRPGMVLLKRHLNQSETVSIVRECRQLGVGQGGFYWGNRQMMRMCLGLDWDPNSREYSKIRSFDNAIVPNIPQQFIDVVSRAIDVARASTDSLPNMSPDICLVNFYSQQGQLNLHTDRSESGESLAKGVPIVSLSLGDSATFLYGDVYDIKKMKKVVLESGDVLIFGGPSRHIFHGVQSILPRTSPHSLKEMGLRPGRLNLTFRQF